MSRQALPPKVLKTEVGVSAHAFPTVASAAPRHLGAEVLGRVRTERWHASLTEDETAVGPVTQAIQAAGVGEGFNSLLTPIYLYISILPAIPSKKSGGHA